MRTLVRRVVGALLALLGLAGAGTGIWLVSSLGSSGTATFTTAPDARVVVLDPQVLNRVDHPVDVTARSESSERLWAGVARPSDVEALLGEGKRVEVSGVDVRSWALETRAQGKGTGVDPTTLDVWQRATGGEGSVTTTIDQTQAPQTLVVAAPEGATLSEVTMSVSDKGWFSKALALLLGGLALLAVGVFLLVRGLRRRDGVDEPAERDESADLDEQDATRPLPTRPEEERA